MPTINNIISILNERLQSAITADNVLSEKYAQEWNEEIREQYGDYPEEYRDADFYKNPTNYASVYYYGRTLKGLANEIGELCEFYGPAVFRDDDLYELFVSYDGHTETYGLVNLSRIERESKTIENEFGEFQIDLTPDGMPEEESEE